MEIDTRIEKFIGRHHVLTLATATGDGRPYCCNLFYAYDKGAKAFVFTSDPATCHSRMMADNAAAAASIVLETRVVGKVQGLQITGRTLPAEEGDKALYIKRFPYAALAGLHLWRMEADTMKFTDNTLGFGKKLTWLRQE